MTSTRVLFLQLFTLHLCSGSQPFLWRAQVTAIHIGMGYHFFPSLITVLLLDFLHTHLAWKLTVLVLIATDIKTFPLVWHASLAYNLSSLLLTSCHSFGCSMHYDLFIPRSVLNMARLQTPFFNRSSPPPIVHSAKWTLTCTVRDLHLHGQFLRLYLFERIQQHVLFWPRHRPNASIMHPLLRWHRPGSPQTWQRRSQCPTRQLHNKARRR